MRLISIVSGGRGRTHDCMRSSMPVRTEVGLRAVLINGRREEQGT